MWVNNACGCVGLKVAVVIALCILMRVHIEFNYVNRSVNLLDEWMSR